MFGGSRLPVHRNPQRLRTASTRHVQACRVADSERIAFRPGASKAGKSRSQVR